MARNITPMEYRRRVFNTIMTECLVRLQEAVMEPFPETEPLDESTRKTLHEFTKGFYADVLHMDRNTIAQTKKLLEDADEFVQTAANVAEELADQKKTEVEEDKIQIPEDQEIELSDEDNAVIDTLFDLKKPDPEISEIRDRTVAALVAEDQKSQEIKQAIEVSQEQSEMENKPAVVQEAVNRINKIGPTSLMNGLLNYFSTQAVKQINESGNFGSISEAMSDNREIIKDRATIMYSLFETSNVLGIKRYSTDDIKKLAHTFYFGK